MPLMNACIALTFTDATHPDKRSILPNIPVGRAPENLGIGRASLYESTLALHCVNKLSETATWDKGVTAVDVILVPQQNLG
jgi:hypothetical protein